jgi:hypothetical protein
MFDNFISHIEFEHFSVKAYRIQISEFFFIILNCFRCLFHFHMKTQCERERDRERERVSCWEKTRKLSSDLSNVFKMDKINCILKFLKNSQITFSHSSVQCYVFYTGKRSRRE